MMRFGLGGALPGTVLIDREGNVFRSISGVINQGMLRKQIESLLATPSNSSAPEVGDKRVSKKPEVSAVPS
jgi:hypothetical protein